MTFQPLLIETTNQKISFNQIFNSYPSLDGELKYQHPDILVVMPDTNSIGIDKIKRIIEWSSLRPSQAKHKLAVILESHRLTSQAQNGLLKILEEPPLDTLIVLQTNNSKSHLPTVLSRIRFVRAEYSAESLPILSDKVIEYIDATFKERSKLIEAIVKESRQEIKLFLGELLKVITKRSGSCPELIQLANQIKQSIKSIESGGNVKLTLQALTISIENTL